MSPRINLEPSSGFSLQGSPSTGLGGAVTPGTGWGTDPFVGSKPAASSRMSLAPKNPYGFASWNEYYMHLQNTPWSARQIEAINYMEGVMRGHGYGAPGGGNMGSKGWGGTVTSGPHLGQLISAHGASLTSFLPGQTISFGAVSYTLPYSENARVPISTPWGVYHGPKSQGWFTRQHGAGPSSTESIIERQRANRGRSRPWGEAYGNLSAENPGNYSGQVAGGARGGGGGGSRSVTSGGASAGYERMSLFRGHTGSAGPVIGGSGSVTGVGYGSGPEMGGGFGGGPSMGSGEVGTSGGGGPVSEGAGPVSEGAGPVSVSTGPSL